MNNTINELLKDEKFVCSVCEADSAEAVKALFVEQGIEMDDEAANACYGKIHESLESELNEEELDQIAGGFALGAAIACGAAIGLGIGLAAVGIYKLATYGTKSCEKKG